MAELATIARPYAEALFKSGGDAAAAEQVQALGQIARDARLRGWADNPKVNDGQVYDFVAGLLSLSPPVQNFLRAVIANGRLAALPEIATQFHALVNAKSGVSDALIQSAFPIADAQLPEVVKSLEQRFARKLNAKVEVKPELIGGIRVVVGDEVLDTSVAARLEQMKVALTA
jgi:F-type H+-transporting ATPase subunit delta